MIAMRHHLSFLMVAVLYYVTNVLTKNTSISQDGQRLKRKLLFDSESHLSSFHSSISQSQPFKKANSENIGDIAVVTPVSSLASNKNIILCTWVGQNYLNCSCRNLTSVPTCTNSSAVNEFHLENNSISTLKNETFSSYYNVTYLDISFNLLDTLEVNCFAGLHKLINLNIRGNRLILNDLTFHPDVFLPLYSLQKLYLNRNTQMVNLTQEKVHYPDQALAKLKNLTHLTLDGLTKARFGLGFLNMSSLIFLTLAGYMEGYCKIIGLYNDTFVNVPLLRYLDMSACYISGKFIDTGVFSPLRHLEVLNLTHNEDIDLENLDKIFLSLKNITSLKELGMHLIVNRYSVGICLDAEYIKNFPQHLETFDAQENNLEAVDREVIKKLSPSLLTLNLSGNKFVFGTYLQDIKNMTNLKELYLNGGSFTYSLPSQYPYELHRYYSKSNCTLYSSDGSDKPNFEIELPPNLTKIEMNRAGLTYRLTALNVTSNNLKGLFLQSNNFPSLEGPIYGLEGLQHLDLSQSSVKIVSKHFFDTFIGLKTLNLSSNLLGDFFFSNTSDTLIFSTLKNLTTLDLSFNNIRVLHVDMFVNLTNLSRLYLANNLLYNFTVDITSMLHLAFLDISQTKIPYLLVSTIYFIDTLSNITINMAKCDISCECENVDFIAWMVQSKAFNKTFEDYLCVYYDYSIRPISDGFNSTIDILNRKCTSHLLLFFMVGSGTVFLFFVLLAGIVYRFRWKIRYLYYAAYLQYRKSGEKDKREFKYDAFVSYDHADEETIVLTVCHALESRGLVLCVHGRDFKAGDYIASNVVKSVCSSRKTLVILTRNMMNSYWCKYEIQMANMESVHTGRQVLIFLLVEKIPENELGVELLYNIRNNTYIPYPPDTKDSAIMNALWSKLVHDIKD